MFHLNRNIFEVVNNTLLSTFSQFHVLNDIRTIINHFYYILLKFNNILFKFNHLLCFFFSFKYNRRKLLLNLLTFQISSACNQLLFLLLQIVFIFNTAKILISSLFVFFILFSHNFKLFNIFLLSDCSDVVLPHYRRHLNF